MLKFTEPGMIEAHEAITAFCEAHGLELAINGKTSHHWQIKQGRRILAQWWPGNGRLVIDEKFYPKMKTFDVSEILGSLDSLVGPVNSTTKADDIAPTPRLKVTADPTLLVRLQGRHWPRPAGESQDAKPLPWLGGIIACLTTHPADTAIATG